MTISEWLNQAAGELADDMFPSARLDAEIILAHTVRHPRTYLHAHLDDEIDMRDQDIADARMDLRKDRVPVAYIIGHKEFYGRRFNVSPVVLIPRPESEQMIELLKELLPKTAALPGVAQKRLVDVGTGSGCLGVTAKLEFPELDVSLTDNSRHALNVAEKNARLLGADVITFAGDLLTPYPYQPDIILANLPYVDPSWDHLSPELAAEPAEALYADDDGLAVIKRCIDQAVRLPVGGLLLLEADPRQRNDIIRHAKTAGFSVAGRKDFAVALRRD